MILSNSLIHKALEDGSLLISPEPKPRMPTADGPECPYQTSAVDLRLGDEIAEFKSGKDKYPVTLDLRHGGFLKFAKDATSSRILADDEAYVLQPNKLILGKTLETIELPIAPGRVALAARVEGRSSFARCGLLVHFTAPTIHAGFRGTITLEIMNFGSYPINLYKGMRICQLIVEQVAGDPFSNASQFQSQNTAIGR